MASSSHGAALWGDLAACYLGEVAAAGIYEQALRHMADPEAHARLVAWLDTEPQRARGLRGHLAAVGPPLPEALVGLVRDLSRLAGGAVALRGPDAAVGLARDVGGLGASRFAALAASFPAGSLEAERYKGWDEEVAGHGEWLAAWRAERAQDGLVGQVETIEHASIVPAPVEAVFEILTGPGHWAAMTGLPLTASVTSLSEDARYTLRLGVGPLAVESDGQVVAWDPPVFFVERRTRLPFEVWERHCRLEPLAANRTLVADRLLVRPKFLPPPPGLQPSPWKLALELGLWWWHHRLEAYLRA